MSRMPTFEEYFAGGLLANAPAWLTMASASYLLQNKMIGEMLTEIFIVASYLLGVMLGGYLVARIAYRDYRRVGLEVGVASFFINIIFTALFGGIPIRITMESFVAQILGGMVGGFMAERKYSKITS